MAQPPPLSHNPYLPPQTRPFPTPQAPRQQPGAVAQAVMSGVRFKIVPYVFSVVIMSFRRNMGGIQPVSTGSWPVGSVIGAVIITMLFGWWGFPWGIIWSIPVLFQLWNGGRDVTSQMLIAEVGPLDAKQILAAAPRPRPPAGLWVARGIILLPPLLIALLFVTAASTASTRRSGKRATAPAAQERPASTVPRKIEN